jgi:hypothetical protein
VARLAKLSGRQPELAQLLAQRAAIDAEDARGAALIAFHVIEHRLEQRLFDFAQHHVVQLSGTMTVQAREVIMQGLLGVVAQRHFLAARSRNVFPARATFFLCWHAWQSPTETETSSRFYRGSICDPLIEMLPRRRKLRSRIRRGHQLCANVRAEG